MFNNNKKVNNREMEINYLKLTTIQVLKNRFKEVQQFLKKERYIKLTDFTQFVVSEEPQFATPEGLEAIRNAWYNKKPNIRLTELMEEYKQHLIK